MRFFTTLVASGCFVFTVFASTPDLHAEIIIQKNGSSISGNIYRQDTRFVYMRIEGTQGSIRIPIEDIDFVKTRRTQFTKSNPITKEDPILDLDFEDEDPEEQPATDASTSSSSSKEEEGNSETPGDNESGISESIATEIQSILERHKNDTLSLQEAVDKIVILSNDSMGTLFDMYVDSTPGQAATILDASIAALPLEPSKSWLIDSLDNYWISRSGTFKRIPQLESGVDYFSVFENFLTHKDEKLRAPAHKVCVQFVMKHRRLLTDIERSIKTIKNKARISALMTVAYDSGASGLGLFFSELAGPKQSTHVRHSALEKLKLFTLYSDTVKTRILKVLGSSDSTSRALAADVLAASRDLNIIPDLIEALTDDSSEVSKAAHKSLVFLTGKSISLDYDVWDSWWSKTSDSFADNIENEIDKFQKGDEAAQIEALESLSEYSHLVSPDFLLEVRPLLLEENPDIVGAACRYLKTSNDMNSIPDMIDLLDLSDLKIQNHALSALHELSGKKYSKNPAKWKSWWKNSSQRKSIH